MIFERWVASQRRAGQVPFGTAYEILARKAFYAGVAQESERRANLAADFAEYLYRVASQVPFEHAAWANERGAALLAALKA